MNTKLLETKLKSIEHYVDVIHDLEGALKNTNDTLEILLRDLKEFCPFQKGDIVCYENKAIYQFIQVCGAHRSNDDDGPYLLDDGPYLLIDVKCCDDHGQFWNDKRVSYYFKHGNSWTILKHAPAENKEQ